MPKVIRKWIVKETPDSSRISKLEFQTLIEVPVPIGNLRVTFKNKGTRYIYYQVPKALFDYISKAESIGKAFHVITDRNFKYEKLPE